MFLFIWDNPFSISCTFFSESEIMLVDFLDVFNIDDVNCEDDVDVDVDFSFILSVIFKMVLMIMLILIQSYQFFVKYFFRRHEFKFK
jgi:hypothetical protein